VKTAAVLLGLSRQQVQNLAASGQLAGEKVKGRWRLRLTHVTRMVNTRHAAAAMARARS
jgi:excisionase family DNA binding protein